MAFDDGDIEWLDGKVRHELEKALVGLREQIDERFAILRLAIAEPLAHLSADGFLEWDVVESNWQTVLMLDDTRPKAHQEIGFLIESVEQRLLQIANRRSQPATGAPDRG